MRPFHLTTNKPLFNGFSGLNRHMKNWSRSSLARCVRRFQKGSPVEVWWRQIKDINPSKDRKPIGVAIDRHIPHAIIVACIGKPIIKVIDHPLIHQHFGAEDTIKEAMLANYAPYGTGSITVFEIRRKRPSKVASGLETSM